MQEYGVSWLEIDREWTLPQVLLFARRIEKRRRRESEAMEGGKKPKPRRIDEDSLKGSPWLQG